MNKQFKKRVALLSLVLALPLGLISPEVSAKQKVRLTKKSITVTKGKTQETVLKGISNGDIKNFEYIKSNNHFSIKKKPTHTIRLVIKGNSKGSGKAKFRLITKENKRYKFSLQIKVVEGTQNTTKPTEKPVEETGNPITETPTESGTPIAATTTPTKTPKVSATPKVTVSAKPSNSPSATPTIPTTNTVPPTATKPSVLPIVSSNPTTTIPTSSSNTNTTYTHEAGNISNDYIDSRSAAFAQYMSNQMGNYLSGETSNITVEDISDLGVIDYNTGTGYRADSSIQSEITLSVPMSMLFTNAEIQTINSMSEDEAYDYKTDIIIPMVEYAVANYSNLCTVFTVFIYDDDGTTAHIHCQSPIKNSDMVNVTVTYQNIISHIVNLVGSKCYSNLDKVSLAHEQVCLLGEYAPDDNNIKALDYMPVGLAVKGVGVCQSYTAIYNQVLKGLGIDARIIDSNVHTWNIVKINNKWYHIDSTWNDSVHLGIPYRLSHQYFLLDLATLSSGDQGFHTVTNYYSRLYSTMPMGNSNDMFCLRNFNSTYPVYVANNMWRTIYDIGTNGIAVEKQCQLGTTNIQNQSIQLYASTSKYMNCIDYDGDGEYLYESTGTTVRKKNASTGAVISNLEPRIENAGILANARGVFLEGSTNYSNLNSRYTLVFTLKSSKLRSKAASKKSYNAAHKLVGLKFK